MHEILLGGQVALAAATLTEVVGFSDLFRYVVGLFRA